VRDSDKAVTQEIVDAFTNGDGILIAWRNGRAIEDELFLSLSDDAIDQLIDLAIELHGEDLIDDHIKSASDGRTDLEQIRAAAPTDGYSDATRTLLGKAARFRAGWFKSVTWMERAAREIIGPDLANVDDQDFRALVEQIFEWAGDGGG
jgi:putative ATP-dependent endonuclease of the OLD family